MAGSHTGRWAPRSPGGRFLGPHPRNSESLGGAWLSAVKCALILASPGRSRSSLSCPCFCPRGNAILSTLASCLLEPLCFADSLSLPGRLSASHSRSPCLPGGITKLLQSLLRHPWGEWVVPSSVSPRAVCMPPIRASINSAAAWSASCLSCWAHLLKGRTPSASACILGASPRAWHTNPYSDLVSVKQEKELPSSSSFLIPSTACQMMPSAVLIVRKSPVWVCKCCSG